MCVDHPEGQALIRRLAQPVADLGGARASLRAAIANYWTKDPKANVVFGKNSASVVRTAASQLGRHPPPHR